MTCCTAQSKYTVYKESTTVSVPSSELGISQPFFRQQVCPASQNQGVGAHSPAGEGLGESQFGRLEKKLSTLPTLCCTGIRERIESENWKWKEKKRR
jgi:hypothetical protein